MLMSNAVDSVPVSPNFNLDDASMFGAPDAFEKIESYFTNNGRSKSSELDSVKLEPIRPRPSTSTESPARLTASPVKSTTEAEKLYADDEEIKEAFAWLTDMVTDDKDGSSKLVETIVNRSVQSEPSTEQGSKNDDRMNMLMLQQLVDLDRVVGNKMATVKPTTNYFASANNGLQAGRQKMAGQKMGGQKVGGQVMNGQAIDEQVDPMAALYSPNTANFERDMAIIGLNRARMARKRKLKFERTDDTFVYDLKRNWGWPLAVLCLGSGVVFAYCYWSTAQLMAGQRVPRHQEVEPSSMSKWLGFSKSVTVDLVHD
ncbi:hypothetical protein HDE_06871 [Halotydeus destructor]|nr:hypothetical protein HDE_06871 [Halotydeus destructor]